MLTISILDMSLKIINRRSKPRLPGANELKRLLKIFTLHVDVMNWTHLSFITIIIIIMQPILIDNSDIARIPYSKHTCVLYLTLEIFLQFYNRFLILSANLYHVTKRITRTRHLIIHICMHQCIKGLQYCAFFVCQIREVYIHLWSADMHHWTCFRAVTETHSSPQWNDRRYIHTHTSMSDNFYIILIDVQNFNSIIQWLCRAEKTSYLLRIYCDNIYNGIRCHTFVELSSFVPHCSVLHI